MPFTYNNTNIAEGPVKNYADLLDTVAKAVTLYEDDTNIKEFYAWLQQRPVNYKSKEDLYDDYDDYDDDHDNKKDAPEYTKATFETLEDSHESQEGIIYFLGDTELFNVYVVKKRLWALNTNCLLLLCKSEDDPRLAVVPLWNSNFEATFMVGRLVPFTDTHKIIYEVCENLSLIMGDPRDGTRTAHRVQHITGTNTSTEQANFISSVTEGCGDHLECSTFTVIIAMNRTVYLIAHGARFHHEL